MGRELLFSVTRNDFRIDTFRAPGNGGQKVNKTSSGVRFTHLESGAVGQSVEHREQSRNRTEAFRRCVATKEFQNWHKRKTAEIMMEKQGLESIEKQVERSMESKNIKVEVKDENGRWVEESSEIN
jgi:protein subunit release factor A